MLAAANELANAAADTFMAGQSFLPDCGWTGTRERASPSCRRGCGRNSRPRCALDGQGYSDSLVELISFANLINDGCERLRCRNTRKRVLATSRAKDYELRHQY